MVTLFLLSICLAASGPARAQAGPAARIGSLIEGYGQQDGFTVPPLSSVAPPAAPAGAPLPAFGSVVPAGLWATLASPNAATLASLSSQVPGVKPETVRVLTFEAADAMLAAAAAHGESTIDFFTDPAFRGSNVFYLTRETAAALFTRYELRVFTPATGLTKEGKPFAMQGLLLGGGRIDALYDLDQFEFSSALFDDTHFTLARHVSERILGPGDMSVEGVWTHVSWFTPKIKRVVETSPTDVRIETNLGSRVKSVFPIHRN